MMKENIFKAVVFAALVLYTISPVDLAPGPIDDAILWIVYWLANRARSGAHR